MAAVQQVFANLGLNTPAMRFAAGTVVTGGALVMLQPEMMFFEGAPRPWSLITAEENTTAPTTAMPWWLAAVSVGGVMATFF